MKIGYAGSPEISRELLEKIHTETGHTIGFVLSNPDKRRGRSGKLQPTPVAQYALEHGIPVHRPTKLKPDSVREEIFSHNIDLFFVFAYGKILPEDYLRFATHGAVNLHASFLPALRGASPIPSAVLQGHTSTGWTLQNMDVEMDAGNILMQSKPVKITQEMTAGDLTAELMPHGIHMVLDFLRMPAEILKDGGVEQDHGKATYCGKMEPEHSWIDWTQPTVAIHRQIMGMNPSPVARTTLKGRVLKVLRSLPVEMPVFDRPSTLPEGIGHRDLAFGEALTGNEGRKKKLFAKTGDGFLELVEIQPENKKPMNATDFLNGFKLQPGDRFAMKNEQQEA